MFQPAITDPPERATANQRSLRRLVLSIQASLHKLNLLIAICDNPLYRDQLICTYEAELTAKGINCYQVRLDRQQPSLKQSLIDWQACAPGWQPETPTLVTVRGGDELLGIRLQQAKSAQERFFFSVQWTREGLREFPFPIVLWVTEAVAQGLAQQAPDFWSWRGGVFEFEQPVAWQLPDLSLELPQPEPTEPPISLADPDKLGQQIAALQAEDPNLPLLASLYQSLGQTYAHRLEQGIATDRPQETAKAIAAFQSAIAHRTTLTDPAPLLATSLNSLAQLYASQGRYEEAEPLLREALQLRRELLGERNPDVATSLNNLALLYNAQGRYEEAEPLYREALQLRRELLGDRHPDVATSLNNLALLYKDQGRYEEAEPLYLEALAILAQAVGTDHPNFQTVFGNFFAFLQGVVGANQTHQLSDHPLVQELLRQVQSS
ncbi:MAG: tetratricopeptide repeat protein [Leptolyngbyaceae cyanobacterium]